MIIHLHFTMPLKWKTYKFITLGCEDKHIEKHKDCFDLLTINLSEDLMSRTKVKLNSTTTFMNRCHMLLKTFLSCCFLVTFSTRVSTPTWTNITCCRQLSFHVALLLHSLQEYIIPIWTDATCHWRLSCFAAL